MKKLTRVQKTTRFIVYRAIDIYAVGMVTGIIPCLLCALVYKILGI